MDKTHTLRRCVKSICDVREFLLAGADKVVVTASAVTNPGLIKEIAEQFGTQCVVAGIDYRIDNHGTRVWIRCGTAKTELDLVQHAISLVELGAGEIFVNSINRDGTMQSYDLEVAGKVADSVSVSVIMAGGAGKFMHLAELLRDTGASARCLRQPLSFW